MCGIYGRIFFSGAGRPDPEACARRLGLMSHRGPDHRGYHAEDGVFLGHARLSILDPEPAAHQPFGKGDRRLIFNGEIYNFLALREKIADGEWKTRSDTEVLYRLLAERGAAVLPDLNGMFAFGYWDGRAGTLLLARDRAGIKPLYYRLDKEGIEFASEIKAFEIKPGRLDGLKEILGRGYLGRSPLPFEGVEELEPGHFLRVDLASGSSAMRPFATLPAQVTPERLSSLAGQGEATLEAELEKRLEASVALHLQSDVPLATLCSGGLDSSLISALARRRGDMTLYHCGIGAEMGSGKGSGVSGSEGEEHFARLAADHLKAGLVVERMDPEAYWNLLPEVTWHLDMPVYFQNDISLHLIGRRARRDGIKVLLCGEGADELFGGYAWHRELQRLLRGRARLAGLGANAERGWRKLRALWDGWLGRPRFTVSEVSRFAAFGLCYPAPAMESLYKGSAFASEDFNAWKRWDECLRTYTGRVPERDAPVQALLLDNLQGHLRGLLHRADRILMANSIEGRVPFLENDLIEFALNLPLRHKIRGSRGKDLLKAVARKHLPEAIVDRPKMGFPVPWQRYLPERPRLFEDGFLVGWTGMQPRLIHALHADDLGLRFRLLALEVWGRIFVLGQKPADIQVR